MADSSDSSKKQGFPKVDAFSSTSNRIKIRSQDSSANTSRSVKRQTRHKSRNERRKTETPKEFSTSFNPDVSPSPIPWETFNAHCSTTDDSQIENSFAFKGCSFDMQRKKRRTKKKSDRKRFALSSNLNAGLESDDSDFEPLTDKLERIPPPIDVEGSSSGLQLTKHLDGAVHVTLRTIGKDDCDEDGFEKNPCRTMYYLRTLDPLHNRFEVVSRGVQTDWSWRRDGEKLDEYELDVADTKGFSPAQNSGNENSGGGDSESNKADTNKESPKKKDSKQSDVSKDIKKPRVSKSAIKTKDENPVVKVKTRKVQSANAARNKTDDQECHGTNETLDNSNNDVENDSSSNEKPGAPAILKYHREKKDIPKVACKNSLHSSHGKDSDEDEELPPTHGLFNGPCQFCGKPILTVAIQESIDDPIPVDQVYCCPEYEHFIELLHAAKGEDQDTVETELIDITPRAPRGVKQNQNTVRERVVDRVREQWERQRTAAQHANVFSFARQMKTIQFSLATAKCFQEGWAVKPRTPSPESPSKEDEIFQVEVNSTQLQKAEILNEKCYENGKKFLTIFPDGTGCCYYPNGNVAVMITSVEKEKYTYIVLSDKNYDDLNDDGILAVFAPFGNAICYHKRNRKIRLFVNAHGGIELDRRGRRKKRWQWYFIKGHVHAPPFQPLCFSLNKFISVRVLDQHNIALIFTAQQRSVRFNVGANLTAHGIKGHGRFEPDASEGYLLSKKKQLSSIISKIHGVLRLPKSSFQPNGVRMPSRKNKKPSPRDLLPPLPSEASVVVT